MKHIRKVLMISLGVLAGTFLASCSKEVDVNLDIDGAENYSMVYMPKANNIQEEPLGIADTVYKFLYSAYLGGSLPNNTNISLKFSVAPEKLSAFNLQNGTSYEMLPEGSYTLDNPSAMIASGAATTDPLHISVNPKDLTPFKSYLLPVSIAEAGAKVNNSLSTTYFVVTGSYRPGEVPREKAFSFGANAGLIMFDFNGNLVRKSPGGQLLLYPAGANGVFQQPRQIGDGWNIFNMVFYYGGNRIIGRWASGGGDSTQYGVDANGNFGASKTVGFGWGFFSKIIPYKGALLGVTAEGTMTMYPLEATDFNYGGIKVIGAGFNEYTQIIPYMNSLLLIKANGEMYQHPLSDTGVFGTPKKVGTGWDMYSLVFSSGSDLLALDTAGDLWRYKFNPAGLWPLKK